jgi:hypothetical protein
MNPLLNNPLRKKSLVDLLKPILLLMLSGFNSSFGQTWIHYGQPYYKILTAKDGIYRIDDHTLRQSGIDPQMINPQFLQLYHRGQEVAILITGEEDGRWDQDDQLYFYGTRNDGTLDQNFFENPSMNGNKLYNIHSDTTAYFLTLSPETKGKRIPSQLTYDPAFSTKQTYDIDQLIIFSDQYHLGTSYLYGVRLPKYEQGSGWMSTPITRNSSRILNFNELGDIGNVGEARLTLGIVGRSETEHQVAIRVGKDISSLVEIGRFTLNAFEVLEWEKDFSLINFNSEGRLSVEIALINDQNASQVSLAYVKVRYPQLIATGDFEEKTFWSSDQPLNYFFEGAKGNYLAWEVSHTELPKQLALFQDEKGMRISTTNLVKNAQIHVQNLSKVMTIPSMQPVIFRDFEKQLADYLIITHPTLRKPVQGVEDPVAAYAAYRSSPEGGGFRVLTVDIQELYDIYSFGEKTPWAIYNFLKKYYPKYQPEYLLLIGRSMGILSTTRVNGTNQLYRKNPAVFAFQDLIPPAGYPYADNFYGVGLNANEPLLAGISIGRLPARQPQDVLAYLEKVKEKDQLGVKEDWQKNILHLSGGLSALELNRYFNFLNGFKTIAEGLYLGGKVKTYRKSSNVAIEVIDVTKDVNEGVSMITFFGHAAPSITDIEIGFASDATLNYRNNGKYPLLFLNGCDAGNAFGSSYTFGEDWVITGQKGAAGFLAHAHIGVDLYLRRYSESFYTAAFSDSLLISSTIGKVKLGAEQLMYQRYGTSAINQSHVENMVYLGDPAVRFFPANHSDFEIRSEEMHLRGFAGQAINSLADSLQLVFVVRNLGKVKPLEVPIEVSRKLPDGSFIVYPEFSIAPVFNRDTVKFTIHNQGVEAFGDNEFYVKINPAGSIVENSLLNNQANLKRFIPRSGPLKLLPTQFGIVNQKQVDLYLQISTKENQEKQVLIELDTTAIFNSQALKVQTLAITGLAKWSVDISDVLMQRDTMTFYWRTKLLIPEEGEVEDWSQSSFTYIQNGSGGWIQRTFEQLSANNLNQLTIDKIQKIWKYEDIQLPIEVFTFGNKADSLTFRNTQLLLNGTPYIIDNINNANSRLCANGSLGLVAFDQRSLVPYLVFPPPSFDVLDNRSCGRVPQVIQNIRNVNINSNVSNNLLVEYINGLKEGDFVVIFTVGNVNFERWPEQVILKMKEVGADESTLRKLRSGDPYVLIGRKGMKSGDALEVTGLGQNQASNTAILTVEKVLEGYFTSGSVLTPRIGPSSEWIAFFNQIQDREWLGEKSPVFEVIGINQKGEESILIPHNRDKNLNIPFISALNYPFLRLRMAFDDPKATIPAQLQQWQVSYRGVPEGALVLKESLPEKKVYEGKPVEWLFEFINLSSIDFKDSIEVDWEFFAPDLKKLEKRRIKIPALKAGEKEGFSIGLNTKGWSGKIDFKITANPQIQLEETFLNNTLEIDDFVEVLPDRSQAILDVNFDGVYIMDGDIVSPTVTIFTTLKNEKSFLYKTDTSGIALYLKSNCIGCAFKRVNFTDPLLEWFPASEKNDFKIVYKPGPLEDGLYAFRVVTEENGSGKPYEVNFEVINESSITNFYPYPNPFSTSVRFVFTLTGAEIPDQVKIQILTVTGRVVKEIFQDEIGPLRIGNNISQYAWDGKDEYGDQLANGVYLYRVLVRRNGQFMELRSTIGDRAFKQGLGKMYLLR